MTGVIENLWSYLAENDNQDKKEMSYLQLNNKTNSNKASFVVPAKKINPHHDSRNATCKKNGGSFFFTNFISSVGKTHSSTDLEQLKSPLKLEEAKEEKKQKDLEFESRNMDDSAKLPKTKKLIRQSSIESREGKTNTIYSIFIFFR